MTLVEKVVCPHCWKSFPPEESLWVAEHPDLTGDPKLDNVAQRFLPSRFTVEGDALDSAGYRSSKLACPECHLENVSGPLSDPASLLFDSRCGGVWQELLPGLDDLENAAITTE